MYIYIYIYIFIEIYNKYTEYSNPKTPKSQDKNNIYGSSS